MLDPDGQAVIRGFNYKRNLDKSAYALRGILSGVMADGELSDMELLFLDSWIRSQDHLNTNQDARHLLSMISDVIESGSISSSDLEFVKEWITQSISRFHDGRDSIADSINSLHGLLLGIIADGKTTDKEFNSLDKWLSHHGDLAHEWPVSVLIDRVNAIKEDGVVDEVENKIYWKL